MTVAKETSKYKLDLVEIQEVKCGIGSDIKEEHMNRRRVFENRVLWRIFGQKKDGSDKELEKIA
jgi:hypothetical protein